MATITRHKKRGGFEASPNQTEASSPSQNHGNRSSPLLFFVLLAIGIVLAIIAGYIVIRCCLNRKRMRKEAQLQIAMGGVVAGQPVVMTRPSGDHRGGQRSRSTGPRPPLLARLKGYWQPARTTPAVDAVAPTTEMMPVEAGHTPGSVAVPARSAAAIQLQEYYAPPVGRSRPAASQAAATATLPTEYYAPQGTSGGAVSQRRHSEEGLPGPLKYR
ncbi:hypothetical protein B0H66DRAFT_567514 [Apodospora peruviana]|uniref:Uncharacterized protein n=1 Tax=Apodospora peruviana TaxID=516989 RepID=A0AAE0HW51_9PEZI|nr:hypothetical protein B0H66DRAFT_567514 [Apodospora peruviana]